MAKYMAPNFTSPHCNIFQADPIFYERSGNLPGPLKHIWIFLPFFLAFQEKREKWRDKWMKVTSTPGKCLLSGSIE